MKFLKNTLTLLIVLFLLAWLLGKHSKIKFLNDLFNPRPKHLKPFEGEIPDREEVVREVLEAGTRAKQHLARAKEFYEKHEYLNAKRELGIIIKKYKAPNEQEVVQLMAMVEHGLQKGELMEKAKLQKKRFEKKKRTRELLRKMKAEYDDDKNITWYRDKRSPSYTNQNAMFLYFSKKDGSDRASSLRLKIQYASEESGGYINIEKYRFDYDGKNYTFTPEKMKRDRDDSNRGFEWSDNSVKGKTGKLIRALSTANDATIRFLGKNGTKKRELDESEKDALYNVLEVYEAMGGRIRD